MRNHSRTEHIFVKNDSHHRITQSKWYNSIFQAKKGENEFVDHTLNIPLALLGL